MTLFWHGHFATSVQKVKSAYFMWRQNEIFRRYGSGNWLGLLTAVSNRRSFFELAETQFAVAQRYNRSLVIMMIDIDHFKQINDEYGHLAGDFVLQIVAKNCRGYLRRTDLFARYGGEEFICLLPEQNETGALKLAERIRSTVATRRSGVTLGSAPPTARAARVYYGPRIHHRRSVNDHVQVPAL